MENKYKSLSNCLIEMKEEYKITPSKFLLKNIELVNKKLRQIDDVLKNKKVKSDLFYSEGYIYEGEKTLCKLYGSEEEKLYFANKIIETLTIELEVEVSKDIKDNK